MIYELGLFHVADVQKMADIRVQFGITGDRFTMGLKK